MSVAAEKPAKKTGLHEGEVWDDYLGAPHTYASVGDKISNVVLTTKVPKLWPVMIAVGLLGTMSLMYAVSVLLAKGVGVWGNNVPVGWAFDIINFVWWIGIGHAGTLISAVLLLVKQQWRTSINRFAEAMTLFAVACAGMYPALHVGRPWLAYWLLPYPNTMGLWPQWRSPLMWDVFAVSTYATVSLLFWYVGLIPDLATLRDKAINKPARFIYGFLSLGWRGSTVHWSRYTVAYLLLAGLSTPLVVSVHTIVSFDFSVGITPGWHATIFPPYFVAGAVFAGFAMVLTLGIPLRHVYGLKDLITGRHLDVMAKVMLTTGLVVGYGYLTEIFLAWYSGDHFEWYMMKNRFFGPYAFVFWLLMLCNIAAIQPLWFKPVRQNIIALFVISMFVNFGMWFERFMIIVMSLHRDFLPSSWGMYTPTHVDIAMFAGTIGFFLLLFFLFVRALPMISIMEMREYVSIKRGDKAASADWKPYKPAVDGEPQPVVVPGGAIAGQHREPGVPQ
ncbi:NrfD/PsrC family molybdoenzyme membrane anchor subunit [Humisphaera borealis]|uniref:Polysulfide reductase NrfD n=1 Tax=Humisphaera borealis TaxID=2807512 RepID=A0A7M2X1I9_9BACT|nr:NrfD/PsrC family molybdoenzyme membrane anchor subunit [Humisphaera borealis]QOV91545.1 polysulfide reductase NrfD [Humisphaera borealis]